MLETGKQKKIKAFSLIEIIVSLAIFSFIITMVIGIAISLIRAETKVQAQLFLTQTAQIAMETMSRELRYGYNYSGTTANNYANTGQTILLNTLHTTETQDATGTASDFSQILSNAQNSPYILFEAAGGNPNTFTDQNVFCVQNKKLYKITKFNVDTDGTTYRAQCSDLNVSSVMLPSDITVDNLSFDILAGDPEHPKNPMVRIKMKLSHPDGGSIEIQTTVTQRLVTYF